MKKLLIASIGAVILTAGHALAADLGVPYYKAPPPPCVWCGWYLGANVGGGWSESTGNFVTATPDFGPAIAAGEVPFNLSLNPGGAIGGGQIGYNWQSGAWVYGIEADIQGSGVRKSLAVAAGVAPVSTISDAADELDWFGTVRGRVGVAARPNWLLYATGGLAYGQTRDSDHIFDPADPIAGGNFASNVSQTRAGWTLGGGTEWMFLPKWSIKVEYLYVDLGSSTATLLTTNAFFPTSSLTYQFTHRYNIARVGLNYHF
jgi:outer membrane immunogenic protein